MNLREAAQQALEALEYLDGYNGWVKVGDEITSLRAALAEDRSADTGKTSDQSEDARGMVATSQESQQVEPVAYCTLEQLTYLKLTVPSEDKIAIYTAPPKREPLTEREVAQIESDTHFHEAPDWAIRFARAIERAHGIGE